MNRQRWRSSTKGQSINQGKLFLRQNYDEKKWCLYKTVEITWGVPTYISTYLHIYLPTYLPTHMNDLAVMAETILFCILIFIQINVYVSNT